MNVSTDLTHFSHIVPCGLHDRGVTSLSKLLDRPVTLTEVKPKLVRAFADTFGLDVAEQDTINAPANKAAARAESEVSV